MISKILDEEGKKIFFLENQVLANTVMPCNCPSPGERLECFNCVPYLEVIKKVQTILYDKPELQCVVPLSLEETKKVGSHSINCTSEQVEECLHLYKEKGNINEVARITGIKPGTIRSWLIKHECIKNKVYTPEDRQRCVDLYHQYRSYTKVSEITGVSVGAIQQWVRKAERGESLNLKFTEGHSKEIREKALFLYLQYGTMRAVTQEMGIGKKSLKSWIIQAREEGRDIPLPNNHRKSSV